MRSILAIIVLTCCIAACNNQQQQVSTSTAESTASDSSSSNSIDNSSDDTIAIDAQLPPRSTWPSILGRLDKLLHPEAEAVETVPIEGYDRGMVSWIDDNIHLVKQGNDTIVLATFGRNYPILPQSQTGYIDLIAAKLVRGKLKIIDTLTHVPSGEHGKYCTVPDYTMHRDIQSFDAKDVGGIGFTRFGATTWGWIISDYKMGDGLEQHHANMFALVDNKIINLGRVKVGESNKYTRSEDNKPFRAYNANIIVMDDKYPRISDLSIVWFTTNNGTDSSSRVTFHKYREGKGYEF
jgi:hypothetical protein